MLCNPYREICGLCESNGNVKKFCKHKVMRSMTTYAHDLYYDTNLHYTFKTIVKKNYLRILLFNLLITFLFYKIFLLNGKVLN